MGWFVCGPLLHPALRAVVLGRAVPGHPGVLPGYRLWATDDGATALPVAGDALVEGEILHGLTPDEADRLAHYMASLGARPADHVVLAPNPTPCRIWTAPAAAPRPWDAADWTTRHAATVTATAEDVMALRSQQSPARIRARYGMMLVRGAARVRAALAPAAGLRRPAAEVQIARRQQPYAHFFAIEEYDLRFRRFDGTLSPVVNRAAFVSGDAVTVLPYDPVRDRVLVIEQFRLGPFARGDHTPWQLEAIAGRIDPGETPEDCARREAVEEAGLTLGALLPVAGYYPSPGAKTEFLYSYVALCDLPDGTAGVFGMAEEAEDIRGHLIGFDTLMDLVATGEVSNAPLLLTTLWLQRARASLRT